MNRAIALINDSNFRRNIRFSNVPLFTSLYGALRYVGLFSRLGADVTGILRSAISTLPQDKSADVLMLRRALERPLHLLKVAEGWNGFISQLLDWLDDPKGAGAVFAAYIACYYLDSIDTHWWQGMVDPLSVERAWNKEAVHAVLEESYKNLGESWYSAPHHTVINTLRVLNYLRAHPNLTLQPRELFVCLALARAAIAASSRLSHPRVIEVRQWSERFESCLLRQGNKTFDV